MYVRCCDCLACSWVEVVRDGRRVDAVECGACGRRFVLEPIEEIGGSVREHYRRAVSFANTQDLDMASAYSVLLGIMSREQAEVLRHSNIPAAPAPTDDPVLRLEAEAAAEGVAKGAPSRASHLPLVPDFDLGFTKAIAQGHLTLQLAMTRGDRDAFASRLQRRHRLPEKLSYDVTDNRVSLRDALREHEQRLRSGSADRREDGERARRPSGRLAAAAVVGLAIAVLTFLTWKSWSEHFPTDRGPRLAMSARPSGRVSGEREATAPPTAARAAEHLLEATEVRTDAKGRVVEINGPDPKSVLIAYCEARDSILGLAPLEITGTVPPIRSARLGWFRDFGAPDTPYAIRIRREATGRWSAGGKSSVPIPVRPAPSLPPDTVRIPISN